MATLNVKITETLIIDGSNVGSTTTQNIDGINGVDNRILRCPTGSYTGLFYFDPSNIDAAVFPTSSFKYGRITNKSNVPVQLNVQTYDFDTSTYYNTTFVVDISSSFYLSTAKAINNTDGAANNPDNFVYSQYISNIAVAPSGSPANIEYYIATT